jgi:uridylate kinase
MLGVPQCKGYMGMLATVINGMALQGALEDKGMLKPALTRQ